MQHIRTTYTDQNIISNVKYELYLPCFLVSQAGRMQQVLDYIPDEILCFCIYQDIFIEFCSYFLSHCQMALLHPSWIYFMQKITWFTILKNIMFLRNLSDIIFLICLIHVICLPRRMKVMGHLTFMGDVNLGITVTGLNDLTTKLMMLLILYSLFRTT
jgi:hypothetical protein